MYTQANYDKLIADLQNVEKRFHVQGKGIPYIVDSMIDRENTLGSGINDCSPEYWDMMYQQACMAAGFRAEEAGIDINKELGRVIY
jgi:hypothetical protein